MTEQERKEVQDKMTPRLAAKTEHLIQLARLQSEGLAKTLTELADTMDACCCGSDSNPMRNFAKSIKQISESIMIGGRK